MIIDSDVILISEGLILSDKLNTLEFSIPRLLDEYVYYVIV